MLVREYGPWGVFERLRERLGVEHSVEDNATYYDRKNAMTCVWCLSVWIGLVLVFVPLTVYMSVSTLARNGCSKD